MALRKPLVIVDGQFQQLQSGDTLDAAVSEVDVVAAINGNAGTITIGQAVYVDDPGSVDLAQANASGTVEVLGLVRSTSVATGASVNVQTDGVLTATTAQWDTVTGGSSGLTAGSVYYLDPLTPGAITTTAPTTSGQYVVRIGKATSATDMEISISQPVKL